MAKAKEFDGWDGDGIIDEVTGKNISILQQKSRLWMMIQNHPEKYGMETSREYFANLLQEEISKGIISYMAGIDEISLTVDENGNHTPHSHTIIYFPNQTRGSKLHKYFPHAALYPRDADTSSIRKYILKDTTGYWYQNFPEKLAEKLPEDHAHFWEWGKLPDGSVSDEVKEKKKNEKKKLAEDVVKAVQAGLSNSDIMKLYPHTWNQVDKIQRARYYFLRDKYQKIVRKMTCIYIEVQPEYTDENMQTFCSTLKDAYIINDYTNPWDGYASESTVVFNCYLANFTWRDFMRYIGGACCELPARYVNGVACYDTIIIISPLSLEGLCDAGKNYVDSTIARKITVYRDYTANPVYGDDYIFSAIRGKWERLYELPPHTEPPVICP